MSEIDRDFSLQMAPWQRIDVTALCVQIWCWKQEHTAGAAVYCWQKLERDKPPRAVIATGHPVLVTFSSTQAWMEVGGEFRLAHGLWTAETITYDPQHLIDELNLERHV